MIHFRPEAAKTSRGRTVMLKGDLVEVIHVRVRRLLRRVRRAQSGPDGVPTEAVRAGRGRAKGPRPPAGGMRRLGRFGQRFRKHIVSSPDTGTRAAGFENRLYGGYRPFGA
jgi:hypothetical protein